MKMALPQEENDMYKDFESHALRNDAIWTTAIKCMAPVGLLLNGCFLYTVVRIKSMQSIVNVYLANLAVSDTTNLASLIVTALWPRSELPGVRTAILYSVSNLTSIASYSIVTALTFERFFAVTRPLTFRSQQSKSRAAKILAVLWSMAIAAGVAYHFAAVYGGIAGEIAAHVMIILFHTTGLFINVGLYACIVKKLREQPHIRSTDNHHHQVRRAIIMLIVNTTIFFTLNITYITRFIHNLVLVLSNLSLYDKINFLHVYTDLQVASFIVHLLNTSLNPLVYSCTNKDYRKAFLTAFSSCFIWHLCPCCQQSQAPPQQPIEDIELKVIHQNQDIPQKSPELTTEQIHKAQVQVHQLHDTLREPVEHNELQGIKQSQAVPLESMDYVEEQIHKGQLCAHQVGDSPQEQAQMTELQGAHQSLDTRLHATD